LEEVNVKKNILRVLAITLTVILLTVCVNSAVAGWLPIILTHSEELPIEYYHYSSSFCGPESGVAIGEYYREEKDYGDLPGNYAMFWDLCRLMDTSWPGGLTEYLKLGNGFKVMCWENGYSNFHYYNYPDVNNNYDFFWYIVEYIDNGWPVVLNGGFPTEGDGGMISGNPDHGWPDWPPTAGHYIVVRGYSYKEFDYMGNAYYFDFRITCSDSYSHDDDLVLDWYYIVDHSTYLKAIAIAEHEYSWP
jgi:hypothetical protein